MDKQNSIVSSLRERLESTINLFNEFETNLKREQQAPDVPELRAQLDEEKEDVDIVIEQADFDRLKLENQRLRARCELLESGNDADVTRRIDDAVNQAHELDTLMQKISEFKHREEKIIETLGKKALELRKAFSRLTGYKVYACKDLIYKVKSEFAEGRDDKFVFQLSPHGKIQLLENRYSSRFSSLISTYIKDTDHFPAFLASVTLELFNLNQANATSSVDMEITIKPRMH